MFCPECQSEYQEGISVCPDCRVTLIPELPPVEPPEEIRWVALKELSSQVEAEMVKESLENEGIMSYLKADFLTTTYGIRGLSLTGSRATLYVPEDRLEEARSIVEDITGES
ncbi:MAG: DUF2007 domain-containing protein [Fidelibacterota bacterium]